MLGQMLWIFAGGGATAKTGTNGKVERNDSINKKRLDENTNKFDSGSECCFDWKQPLPDKAVVADIIDSTRLLPWGHWWILRR